MMHLKVAATMLFSKKDTSSSVGVMRFWHNKNSAMAAIFYPQSQTKGE